MFTKLGNWFSDLGDKIGNWFSDLWTNIDSGLRTLSSNLVGGITDFSDKLDNVFKENDEKNNDNADNGSAIINENTSTIKSKFSFVDNIKNNVNDMVDTITDNTRVPKFQVNVNSKWYTGTVTVVDFSWYDNYREFGDNVICIFCYLGFLWNIFKRLPDIIQGAGASSYSMDMINDIKTYKVTGFGRSSNMFRR